MNSNLRIRSFTTFLSQGLRSAQEDHILIDSEKGVFIIADGFGGTSVGKEASETSCQAVKSFLFKEGGDRNATLPFILRNYFSLAGNVLFNALIHANRKLLQLNRDKGVHERGGSSVLAAYLDGDLLALANVGVCSAWLIREGKTASLVTSRSYSKLCDPFVSGSEPSQAFPLIALGMYGDLEPEIVEFRIRPGDWLLLLTDGFAGEIFHQIADLQRTEVSQESLKKEIETLGKAYTTEDNGALAVVVF